MKNKKKILIFLLSAACLTAGAFGIAACKDKTPDNLKKAYESYAENLGGNALSYEEWLLMIKQDVKPAVKAKYLSSAKIGSDNELSFTYSDGTSLVAGKLTADLVITYPDNSTQTINIPAAASAAKKDADAGLKSSYAEYAQAAGSDAYSYEQWLELIKNDMLPALDAKTVTGARLSEKNELVLSFGDGTSVSTGFVLDDLQFTFENGTSQTATMPKLFTATALDTSGKPVQNVWIEFYYYDPATYFSTVISNAPTDADGKAYFTISEINTSVRYYIGVSDPANVSEKIIPDGYELVRNDNSTTTDFDENRNSVIKFKYVPDSFSLAKKQKINYKREDIGFDIKETNEAAVKELGADRYGYFVFQPYKQYTAKPGDTENDVKTKEQKALNAATGKYRVKLTCDTPDANAVMYYYSGSSSYIPCDENTGIPSAIRQATGTAPSNASDPSVYTGTDYIDVNLYKDIARAENIFGVHADKDCTVTITIERLGNATEPPAIVEKRVQVTGSLFKFANQSGTLTEVDVDNSVSVVKGSDGFYHIGSATGPILLVNLTQAIDRVAECAIKDMPLQEIGPDNDKHPIGESVFTFITAYDANGFITEKSNYATVISTYAQYVNDDGVYGVTQDLYDFLHLFASNCLGVTEAERDSWWLLPCQYYA